MTNWLAQSTPTCDGPIQFDDSIWTEYVDIRVGAARHRLAFYFETAMFDIQIENVMPLAKAAAFVGKLKNKKVHTSTIYRWIKVVRKGCRLECISVGGTMCTSVEALPRFFGELKRLELPQVPRVTADEGRRAETEPIEG
ncbi:MAG: DUF1580 domain-containing protein [Planctomycetota bacterium]